jgi:GxxExxY protein
MSDIALREEVFQIIGAAIEVHKELGSGFLEVVYQETLEIELAERGIPFQSQAELHVRYKNRLLQKKYCADLVCFGSIIVELKSVQKIGAIEEAQLINYLKSTGLKVGLLINFGAHGKLEWKRFVV